MAGLGAGLRVPVTVTTYPCGATLGEYGRSPAAKAAGSLGRAQQAVVQRDVVNVLDFHPTQACGTGVTGNVADRGFGDAQCCANLAQAEVAAVQQLQCVSYLAHGDPWCGHSWVPVKKPASLRLVWVTRDTAGVSAIV